MQLLEQPSVVQQAYGTLTEAGTQFAAPVVLGSSAGRRRRVGVAGSLLEARRLAALCDGLSPQALDQLEIGGDMGEIWGR